MRRRGTIWSRTTDLSPICEPVEKAEGCAGSPMASKSTAGKGAAEEPEPEPGPPASTPSSYEYDPSAYQPPHPDDVGRGGGGGDGKPTKKVQAKGKKAKGKAKAKAKDDGTTHRCGNCDAPNATSKCMRCCVEHYCGHECQKVRGGAAI